MFEVILLQGPTHHTLKTSLKNNMMKEPSHVTKTHEHSPHKVKPE